MPVMMMPLPRPYWPMPEPVLFVTTAPLVRMRVLYPTFVVGEPPLTKRVPILIEAPVPERIRVSFVEGVAADVE